MDRCPDVANGWHCDLRKDHTGKHRHETVEHVLVWGTCVDIIPKDAKNFHARLAEFEQWWRREDVLP